MPLAPVLGPQPKHVFIKYSRNQQFHLFEHGRMVHSLKNDDSWNPVKKLANPRTKRPYNLCMFCANYLDGKSIYNRNIGNDGSQFGRFPKHLALKAFSQGAFESQGVESQ